VHDLIKHFVRLKPGLWECRSFAEIVGPNGRIQVTPGLRFVRGTRFMGADLAEWLEAEYEREKRARNWSGGI
jgi:hypothetical protein